MTSKQCATSRRMCYHAAASAVEAVDSVLLRLFRNISMSEFGDWLAM